MIAGYMGKSEDDYLALRQSIGDLYDNSFKELSIDGKKKSVHIFYGTKHNVFTYHNDDKRLLLMEGFVLFLDSLYSQQWKDSFDDPGFRILDLINNIDSSVNWVYVNFKEENENLILGSCRCNAGRIWYKPCKSGMFFSSDLRVLIGIDGFKINSSSAYAIIKYGMAPDPFTIDQTTFSVPLSHFACIDKQGHITIKNYFKLNYQSVKGDYFTQIDCLFRQYGKRLSELDSEILVSGGVDSSVLLMYLAQNSTGKTPNGHFIAHSDDDPDIEYAEQVAEHFGTNLKCYTANKSILPRIISEIITNYRHPFSDIAVISTYFLQSNIDNPGVPIIEGSGADRGFANFPPLSHIKFWSWQQKIPNLCKKILRRGYSTSLWESDRTIAKLYAMGFQTTPAWLSQNLVTEFPIKNSNMVTFDDVVSKQFSKFFEGLIEGEMTQLDFINVLTNAGIFHCSASRFAAKVFQVGSNPLLISQPFLCLNVLNLQSKIPWEVKYTNNTPKYLLKKLLTRGGMSRNFVHRKKSAMLPPFERWIPELLLDFIQETLVDDYHFLKSVIPCNFWRKSLTTIKKSNYVPSMFITYSLWGATFLEHWLKSFVKE